MKFFSRTWQDRIECRLFDDEMRMLFHLRVPENTIDWWEIGVRKWAQMAPMELQELLSQIDDIRSCQPGEDAQIVFLKVLSAIANYLEQFQDYLMYAAIIREVIANNSSLNLVVGQEGGSRAVLYIQGKVLQCPLPQGVRLEDLTREWDRLWLFAFPRLPKEEMRRDDEGIPWAVQDIKTLLINVELLDAAVLSQVMIKHSGLALMYSYAGLLRALRVALEEGQIVELLAFRRTALPILYALLVKNEVISADEEKFYLNLIFTNSYMRMENKERLLLSIARDLKQDMDRDPRYTARLSVMATATTRYYLKRYDINRALQLWKNIGDEKDRLLRFMLMLYRHPWKFAVPALGLVVASLIAPKQHYVVASISNVGQGSTFFPILLLVSLTGVWMLHSLRRLLRRSLSYIELFFPRLLGAIIAGLSVLLFENTVWDITCKIEWGNLIILLVSTYVASYLYFLVDVHKTIRAFSSVNKEREIQCFEHCIDSPKTAWNIFLISLFEALVTTFVISGLLGEVLIQKIGEATRLCVTYDILEVGSILRFVYIPRVVLLWAGLSLFIGAFVQLLWQDRQVTIS